MTKINNVLKICNIFYKISSIRSKSFNWNDFKRLKDPDEIFSHAEQLESISEGEGTSREVFLLTSKWVLKVALPDNLAAGIDQNSNEKNLSDDLNKGGQIVARVTEHHPDYIWVKSELVRPVFDLEELLSLLNLKSPQDMMYLFGKFPPSKWKVENPSPVALKVSSLVRSGVLHYDVMKSNSWGVTSDGNPVLLDYGMNKEVYLKHYKR